MSEELGYIHLVTKVMWDQKRREKIKANQINNYIINKSQEKIIFLEKYFHYPIYFLPNSHANICPELCVKFT